MLSRTFSLLALVLMAVSLHAEEPARVPLTMEDAIQMTLDNNLDIQWSLADISLNDARLWMAWGEFDPKFSFSAAREHFEIPQNSQQFVATQGVAGAQRIFEEDNFRMSSGLEGALPLGTRYGFRFRADRLDDDLNRNPQAAAFHPEYATSAALEVRQPLLRDFGFPASLVAIRVQRKDKEISELNWVDKVREAVAGVVIAYNEMQFGVENIRVKQAALDADRRLLASNRRRFELGFLSPLDVSQAEVAVSEDEELLIAAKNQFIESQYKLQRLILGDHKARPYQIFEPVGSLKEQPAIVPPRDRLLAMAYENRTEYLVSIKEMQKSDIRLRYARNQLLPSVDMVGSYGYSGLQGKYSDSWEKTFGGSAPQLSVGVQVSVPLGSVKERYQLAAVKSLRDQAEFKFRQSELGIGIDVDTALSRIELNRQHLVTARRSRELAEEAVRLANRRLEEGQVSSFDVLEQRKKLYQAQTRELAAISEYNINLVQLGMATGTVLRDYGILLDPPKRSKKAKR